MKKTTVLVAIAATVVVEDGGVDTVVAFIVATICLPTYLPNLPA